MTGDLRTYRATELLRDGGTVDLRAIRPEDKTRLRDAFRRLSARSVYCRFLGARRSLSDAELVHLAEVDFDRHVALVATVPEGCDERIVGVGRYIRLAEDGDPALAEVALTIADEHQGRGIATALLHHLARIGHANGVENFAAEVLGDNHRILQMLDRTGVATTRAVGSGVVHVTIPTAPFLDPGRRTSGTVAEHGGR